MITITNPHPTEDAEANVTDTVSPDIAADVDCNGDEAGNGLPVTIPAGDSVECTYSASLPDGEDRTNTATADSQTDGIGDGTKRPGRRAVRPCPGERV